MDTGNVDREAMFLRILKRTVYDNPGSPCLDLLKMAGCDPSLVDCGQTGNSCTESGHIFRLRERIVIREKYRMAGL